MKKILIAAMTASILMAFTACTDSESTSSAADSSAAEITTTTTAETTTTTEETTTTTAETTPAPEETSAAEESTSADENTEDGVYTGKGYTITVDPTVWADASAAISAVGDYAEEADVLDVTSEDIQNANDGMFMYIPDAAVNFNIVATEIGSLYGDDTDMSLFGNIMETQYGAMDGCEYLGDEVIKINGYNCLKVEIKASAEVFGADMKMAQYLFLHNGYEYVLTYSAAAESYDAAFSDFETVLNSFTYAD